MLKRLLVLLLLCVSSLSNAARFVHIAGSTALNGQIDGGVGVQAIFYYPQSLVFDKNGDLLVLDQGTNQGLRGQYLNKKDFEAGRCFASLIRKVSLTEPYPVTTFAGQRVARCDVADDLNNDGGLFTAILYTGNQLNINPVNGDLYMSQLSDGKIRQVIDQSVTTFPGTRFRPDIKSYELWSKKYGTDQGVAYGNGKLFANGYWRPNIRQYSLDGAFEKEFDLQSAGCKSNSVESVNNGGLVFLNDALYTTCGNKLVRVVVDNGSVEVIYEAPYPEISSISSGQGHILFSVGYQISALNVKSGSVIDIANVYNGILSEIMDFQTANPSFIKITGLALSDSGQVYFSMSNGRIYRVDDFPPLPVETETVFHLMVKMILGSNKGGSMQ